MSMKDKLYLKDLKSFNHIYQPKIIALIMVKDSLPCMQLLLENEDEDKT